MSYYNNNMGERLCANKDLYVSVDSPKKQKMKDRQMQRKLKESKLNKFQVTILLIILIAAIIFASAIVIIAINMSKKIELTDDTIFTTLDVSKYSTEIVSMYNRDGELEKFESEMNRLQGLVGTYIVENMTISDSGLKNVLNDINNELKAKTWNKIVNNKSTYYIGSYSVDDKGSIKFKFKDKSIEPSWINDDRVSKYIILN